MVSLSRHCVIVLLCAVYAVIALPVSHFHHISASDASLGKIVAHPDLFDKNLGQIPPIIDTTHDPEQAPKTSTPPPCNSGSIVTATSSLLRRPHSFFISAKGANCAVTGPESPVLDVESAKKSWKTPPAAYAVIQSLNSAERLLAPVVILFVMVWVAVLGIGLVEGMNVLWRRWNGAGWGWKHFEQEDYLVGDEVLEEIVISLVPLHDDESDDEYAGLDTNVEKRVIL